MDKKRVQKWVQKVPKKWVFGHFLVIFWGPGLDSFWVSFCTVILDKKRSWEDPKMGQKWSKKGCFLAIFSHFWHFLVIHFGDQNLMILVKKGSKSGFFGYFLVIFRGPGFEPFLVSFCTVILDKKRSWEDPKMGQKWSKKGCFLAIFSHFWHFLVIHFGDQNLMILAKNGEKMVFLKNRFFSTFVGKRALILEKKVQKSGFFRFFRPSFFRSCSGGLNFKDGFGWFLNSFPKKGSKSGSKKGFQKPTLTKNVFLASVSTFWPPFLAKFWGPSIPKSRMPSLGHFWTFLIGGRRDPQKQGSVKNGPLFEASEPKWSKSIDIPLIYFRVLKVSKKSDFWPKPLYPYTGVFCQNLRFFWNFWKINQRNINGFWEVQVGTSQKTRFFRDFADEKVSRT